MAGDARELHMLDVLRYPASSSALESFIDGYLNFHFVTSDPARTGLPCLLLSRGIWAPSEIAAADGSRRGLLALRSTPWNAGGEFNPWHDEFDLHHGHIRYFGDHKPTTLGLPGATLGNRALMEAWELHSSPSEETRLLAPPILMFRSVTARREGVLQKKGFVEFCGVCVIERLEYVVQQDPRSGKTFPNIVVDLVVADLAAEGDALDMRWIDNRRNPEVSAQDSLKLAPQSWRRWVREGRSALSRVRRRPLSSRVRTKEEQLPSPGGEESKALDIIYRAFDGHRHAFELLAARVAAEILGSSYREGWLTRSGGDGGVDFVGRIDVGGVGATAPLVVLGQAKCVQPDTSISPDQVARVVARLRRGWVGVFVTTGHYSRQAQVEVIDDQYPLLMVSGQELAACALRIAARDFGGSLEAVVNAVLREYPGSVTSRRPEEVLTS